MKTRQTDVDVAFVQLADGTVYATASKRPVVKPVPRGMMDEEIDAAWNAHLCSIAHVDD